MSLISRERHS